MIVSQSANLVQNAFTDLWLTVVQSLPAILMAVIIFVIGLVFGAILFRIVEQVVKVLRIDDALRAAGLNEAAKTAGFNLDIGRFLGTIVKWFVVIVFLVAALDVLGLNRVTAVSSKSWMDQRSDLCTVPLHADLRPMFYV